MVPLLAKDMGDPVGALFKKSNVWGQLVLNCKAVYPSWATMGSGSHPALGTGTSIIPLGYLSTSTGPAPSSKG